MSMLGERAEAVDEAALRPALAAVVSHHDALRMRFTATEGEWRQEPFDSAPVLEVVDLSTVDGGIDEVALGAQRGLDLRDGPVMRAVLCLGETRPVLFLTVHHLVMDGVSWRILLADLETAYRQAGVGRPIELGHRSSDYRRWALRLGDYVRAGGLDADMPYWSAIEAADLPVDRAGVNTAGSARPLTVRLGRDDTDALLHRVPGVYRTQVNDVLLSALGRALAGWTGRDRVLIGMEGHGREDFLDGLDLSRTVGWFTAEYPLALTLPPDGDWGAVLKSVKEQLRAVPHRGLSYGALRYLGDTPEPATAPQPGISFNYHGQWDAGADGAGGLFRSWRGEVGQDQAPDSPRTYLLDITGVVQDGELELGWTYSTGIHDEATVRRVADGMVGALREIVAHCARPEAGGRTPSDFPLAHLDQAAVDRLAGDGRTVEDIYPLTPLQAGMLFHSLIDPAGAYFDQLALRVSGVGDPEAFAAAWQRTVDAVPALRTSLVWEGVDEPVQVVHRAVTVPVTQHDWRRLSEGDRQAELDRVLADDRAAGIDLTRAPLLRLVIARWTDDEIVLVWTAHHIALDGWSTGQVFAEVCERYAAAVGRREPDLPTRRPFVDYLRWLARQDRHAAGDHWRGVLSGGEAGTPLPYDRPPAGAHAAESARSVHLELSPEESHRVHRAAMRNGLTVNTLVQGAWALLLARYSGERDVLFGTTVSGRPPELPGVESMVGMFINTVPTRVTVRNGQPTREWLRELQARESEARRFDFTALSQLQALSGVSGNLFDSAVVFENYPFDDTAGAEEGLRVRDVRAVDPTNFPLTLSA